MKYLLRGFSFLNQKILRNSKESSISAGGVFTIIAANISHQIRSFRNVPLELKPPNQKLPFPLPNRWSNPQPSLSKQQLYMNIKQVLLSIKTATMVQRNKIYEDPDISRGNIHIINSLGTNHIDQIKNVEYVQQKFNVLSKVEYTLPREYLFADSLVNGQVSYMLRKYGVQYYELPESRQVDEDYRRQFERALQQQTWNQNVNQLGLSKEDIIRRVEARDGVYSILFEYLQKQSKGNVIEHMPEIYCENLHIDEMHYLHVPYPVFLRVQGKYVCIAVGVRIDGRPKFFSPFFASQNEEVWRLVQSHMNQVVINDFSVRVHLGLYHFTTSQYNVPVFKCLEDLQAGQRKDNFKRFIDCSYGIFSRGLEGVNVSATASLVHPQPKYSIVNKTLNLSQDLALSIIAETSNILKIYQFDPRTILRKQGISEEEVHQNFEKMSLDFELYNILSEYVEGAYQAFRVIDVQKELLAQIDYQNTFMAVGKGNKPRPQLKSKDNILPTLKNLCFTWVGFHSHTFSSMSLSTYYLFRPSMLKEKIPQKESDWQNIKIGDELPDAKIMMEVNKLAEATAQRDPDNFLLDSIRRQFHEASYQSEKYQENSQIGKAYRQMKGVAQSTFDKLEAYEVKVNKLNAKRRQQGKGVVFEWMVPSRMETSLNI